MNWNGRIDVTIIPHALQRFGQCGDWHFDSFGELHVRVSDAGNWASNWAIAAHEIHEALRCRAEGVAEITVDEWDKAHADHDDPGRLALAPYHDQHVSAERLEKLTLNECGQSWDDHVKRIDALD